MDILYDYFGENALVGVITVLVSLIYGGIMLYYTLRKRPSSGKKSKTSKEDLKASTGDVKGAAASAAPTSGAAAAPSSNGDSASVSMKADRVSFYASSDHSHHRIKPQAQVFVLPPLRILLTVRAWSGIFCYWLLQQPLNVALRPPPTHTQPPGRLGIVVEGHQTRLGDSREFRGDL